MKITLAQSIAAVVGVALLGAGWLVGYLYGVQRPCEVIIHGQQMACSSAVLIAEQNGAALEQARNQNTATSKQTVVMGNHVNAVLRAMYEDLRATKSTLSSARDVINADSLVINAYDDNNIARVPSAFGEASQALSTLTASVETMQTADKTYAKAIQANPLTLP